FSIIAGAINLNAAPDEAATPIRIRKLRGKNIDDATHSVRPVENARWSANDLDSLRSPGVQGRSVFVAPRIIFQAVAVTQNQDSGPAEAADNGLADLAAGGERANAGKVL